MKPLAYFEAVWDRCLSISSVHTYISNGTHPIVGTDELLRAEWVARVSALDLYVHELVAQRMLEIFEGIRPHTDSYSKFKITNDTLSRIRLAQNPTESSAAFDLDVRNQLSLITYQDPEKIADGIRLFSKIELWNTVALKCGATYSTQSTFAKSLKKDLSLIIARRNKIAHEGDLQPGPPRQPWAINTQDLIFVKSTIEKIVRAIDNSV
ncbi:HEPN domain-containing protein [Micavibrio aeruginosavorus]|uniref:HEPN domain-containing protein n=1 Tax=Micavibrio aeruginosavorus TaxID=349221 RepID=UPI003F4AAA4A